jgi:uncharacterized protein YyaL (SSP411 family)
MLLWLYRYYPPKDMMRGGMLMLPGFKTILLRIADMWEKSREDIKAKVRASF